METISSNYLLLRRSSLRRFRNLCLFILARLFFMVLLMVQMADSTRWRPQLQSDKLLLMVCTAPLVLCSGTTSTCRDLKLAVCPAAVERRDTADDGCRRHRRAKSVVVCFAANMKIWRYWRLYRDVMNDTKHQRRLRLGLKTRNKDLPEAVLCCCGFKSVWRGAAQRWRWSFARFLATFSGFRKAVARRNEIPPPSARPGV